MTFGKGIGPQHCTADAGIFAPGISLKTTARGMRLVRNSVLAGLPVVDFDRICHFLKPVALKEHAILQEPNRRVEHVDFVEAGIVSLITSGGGSILETAMVGSRGFTPMSVVIGSQTSPHQSRVLISGRSLRICVEDLQRLMFDRPQIRDHLLRYVQSLMIHGSQTALCGVRHGLEQRLASWLCLASDALGADVIPITHERLSLMLGLHRPGVTKTLNKFEEQGLVRNYRGVVQVCGRDTLERRTCCCYPTIINAYR